MSSKGFLMGFGVGIAFTMVALDIWAGRLRSETVLLGQPRLLRPLLWYQMRGSPTIDSSRGLPHPWLPTPSNPHRDRWSLRSMQGSGITLGELKGKVVFLSFWGTTCGPCVGEMPGIEALYKSLKGQPVAFVVATQESEQTVRNLLKKMSLSVPVYLAPERIPEGLEPPAIPTTFILDRSGAAVYREVGAVNWDDEQARSFIRKLAKQQP
jgi:thiol-disulfide isomerase/thioredoxin